MPGDVVLAERGLVGVERERLPRPVVEPGNPPETVLVAFDRGGSRRERVLWRRCDDELGTVRPATVRVPERPRVPTGRATDDRQVLDVERVLVGIVVRQPRTQYRRVVVGRGLREPELEAAVVGRVTTRGRERVRAVRRLEVDDRRRRPVLGRHRTGSVPGVVVGRRRPLVRSGRRGRFGRGVGRASLGRRRRAMTGTPTEGDDADRREEGATAHTRPDTRRG